MTPPSTPSDDWAALPVEPALSTLVDLVEIHHAGGPILDAGCGTGRVHEALMRRLVLRPHGYVGVDHTPTAVAQAAARYPAADFKVAERAALPFASRAFGSVVCVDLDPASIGVDVAELLRVARDQVFLQVPLVGAGFDESVIRAIEAGGGTVRDFLVVDAAEHDIGVLRAEVSR